MKISPSLHPSPLRTQADSRLGRVAEETPRRKGRETFYPSPLGGEGWVRGIFEPMTTLRYLLVSIIIALSVLSFAGNALCEEKTPSFTNDDIDKYRSSSDNRPREQSRTHATAKDGNRKAREQQEQDYWCKRATTLKRKIENAGWEVRELEEQIAREQTKNIRTSRKINTLQSRLKKAKDHLSSAERDLNDIENEAHRKSIPPGWLRCQFD